MNGIINIDKTKGITSFDVIRKLRKLLREKSIGHTGTLDPLATGVLVICLGQATRLAQDIEAKEKTYIASLDFGYKTDTLDVTGTILEKKEYTAPSKEEFVAVCKSFIGEISQVPPMYSAIKVDGQRLYDLARQGIEVERKARVVNISSIDVLSFTETNAIIKCSVSKGTYIRTLIDDIGEKLGIFATMTDLLRQEVGEYHINKSYSLAKVEEMVANEDYSFLLDVEDVFDCEKLVICDEKNKKLLFNGNKIAYNKDNGMYKIFFDDKFFGLGIVEMDTLKPYKYFNINK